MKKVMIKFGWIVLVLLGLVFALRGFMPSSISNLLAPKEIYSQIESAISPPKFAMVPYSSSSDKPKYEKIVPMYDPKDEIRKHEQVDNFTAAAGAPEKDWTDYVDKIVGWIVALAGAYKLFQKIPQPQPAPQPTPQPTPQPAPPAPEAAKPKKPRKPRKRTTAS